jgi:hypothetical protein
MIVSRLRWFDLNKAKDIGMVEETQMGLIILP